MTRSIPFFRPSIGDAEIADVASSLRSGWLTTGPACKRFEDRFAEFVGASNAVALNSATAALHLCLVAAGIGPDDEVILPTMTFAAGAEVVLAVGATPVLVDSSPGSLAMDPDLALQAVTAKTRAVMPMHYGGCPVDMAPYLALRNHRPDIVIIDDAAHAFPAHRDDKYVGSGLADASCFSFYANKTITTGEGGMVTTNNSELADRIRRLSLHGLSRDAWNRWDTRSAWDYDIVEPGWKYNLTDLAASIGLAQLDKAEGFAKRRRAITHQYDEIFANIEGLTPIGVETRDGSAAHLYPVRLDDSQRERRDSVITELGNRGIGTSVHYRPIHMHSYYRDCYGYAPEDFPVAQKAFDEMISLPIFPDLTETEVQVVTRSLIEASADRLRSL